MMVWEKGHSFKMTIFFRVSIRQISGVQFEKDSLSTMQKKNTLTQGETSLLGLLVERSFVMTSIMAAAGSEYSDSQIVHKKTGFGGEGCSLFQAVLGKPALLNRQSCAS